VAGVGAVPGDGPLGPRTHQRPLGAALSHGLPRAVPRSRLGKAVPALVRSVRRRGRRLGLEPAAARRRQRAGAPPGAGAGGGGSAGAAGVLSRLCAACGHSAGVPAGAWGRVPAPAREMPGAGAGVPAGAWGRVPAPARALPGAGAGVPPRAETPHAAAAGVPARAEAPHAAAAGATSGVPAGARPQRRGPRALHRRGAVHGQRRHRHDRGLGLV
jgi:hypothetical protein